MFPLCKPNDNNGCSLGIDILCLTSLVMFVAVIYTFMSVNIAERPTFEKSCSL